MISFNSSMVRLGGSTHTWLTGFGAVSIPVWCDWESGYFITIEGNTKFQFQYGAIGRTGASLTDDSDQSFNSSMVRLGALARYVETMIILVSIPVWCDWEAVVDGKREVSMLVSIPVWCDWEKQPPTNGNLP